MKNNYKNRQNKAFTLIELLVVVAIIGVLTSVVLVFLSSGRAKTRDTRKISDLKQMQNALEMYYTDNGNYPDPYPGAVYLSGSWSYSAASNCSPTNLPLGRVTIAHWSDVFDSNFTNLYIKTLPDDSYNCLTYRSTNPSQNENCYASNTDLLPAKNYQYYFTFDSESSLPLNTYPALGSASNSRRCIFGPAK